MPYDLLAPILVLISLTVSTAYIFYILAYAMPPETEEEQKHRQIEREEFLKALNEKNKKD